jgi:phage shock protein PspC (stress-responsive transcriptional regulator)
VNRLYRSRTDTILGGVASGLATYLKADPALVRIAWAVLVPLTGGIAFLAYIVGWVVIPEEPSSAVGADGVAPEPGSEHMTLVGASGSTPARRSGNPGMWLGVVLVVLGGWFLLRPFMPTIDWSLIWPLIIVVIGIAIVVTVTRQRG